MEFKDFYDIAIYGNESWRAKFTPKEIACNAYDYYEEFEISKALNKITNSLKELMRLLEEDGSEECQQWLTQIKYELVR